MRATRHAPQLFACAAMLLLTATAVAEARPDVDTAPASLPAAERAGSAWDVLLADGGHDRFLELADRVGLRRVLDGAHDVTVFAPTDAAFEAVPAPELKWLLAPENRGALRRLIGGHFIWGQTRSTDVEGLVMRPTMSGFGVPLSVAEADGDDGRRILSIGDVPTIEADRQAGNGVVHRIDALVRHDTPAGADGELRHAPACDNDPGHGHGSAGSGRSGGRGGSATAGRGTRGRNAPGRGVTSSERIVASVILDDGSAGPGAPERPGGGRSGAAAAGGGGSSSRGNGVSNGACGCGGG